MSTVELNIIVCIDPSRCLRRHYQGRSGEQLLKDLRQLVQNGCLQEKVQVTPCRCIFGCTYGPRIDVARRWSGEKLLYGSVDGKATISRRGDVEFARIPENLLELIQDNLPRGSFPAFEGG